MSTRDDNGDGDVEMEEAAEDDGKSPDEAMDAEDGEADPTKFSMRNREKLLQDVCLSAKIAGGMARGLRQVVKKLERNEVQFCMLAQDLDDGSYNNLVRALCRQQSVPIVEVETRQQLGLIAGQYKMRVVDETYFEYPRVKDFRTGKDVTKKVAKVRKVPKPGKPIPCSSAVVCNHGRDGESAAELEERFIKPLRQAVESAAPADGRKKREVARGKR